MKHLFAGLAAGFLTGSDHYVPFTATEWHPIYETEMSPDDRRQTREEMLPYEWSEEVWFICRNFWQGKCAACGRKTKRMHRDHLVPLADVRCPGATIENLLPLCPACNKAKGAQDFGAWHLASFNEPVKTTTILYKIGRWQTFAAERWPDRRLRRVDRPQWQSNKRKMRKPRRNKS